MMVILLLMVFAFLAYAQECNFCDSSCGDWSCITNCSNSSSGLAFDTYRCAVDGNGNGQIDSCAELPACSNLNGKYVCPVDVNDGLCTSGEWKEPIYYDPDPNNFESNWWTVFVSNANWTYSEYQQKLSQYNLSCVQAPSNSSDSLYRYLASNNLFPVWTCDGVLYADVWFSYNSCSYVSFDGSQWKVKDNACFNPDKVWQKIGQRCYGSVWSHSITFPDGFTVNLTWNVHLPQDKFDQTQTFEYGGRNYTVRMRCVDAEDVDEASGQSLSICKSFEQTVSGSGVNYTLTWNVDDALSCSSVNLSHQTSYTRETLALSRFEPFTGVVEERRNNLPVKAVGLDQSNNRCRRCDTTLSGLTGGVEKSLPEPDESEVVPCQNVRFFSGRHRTCRAGGATVYGASCCGISGWFKGACSQGERELKKLREAELCVFVGSYCSKKVPFVGCVERKRSFCCFNSSLARIFHECGRPQIGRYFGNPRRPDCKGFTPEEFSQIDFSTDSCQALFEEYVNKMLRRLNLEAKANEALHRVQNWINSQMKNMLNLNREPSRGN